MPFLIVGLNLYQSHEISGSPFRNIWRALPVLKYDGSPKLCVREPKAGKEIHPVVFFPLRIRGRPDNPCFCKTDALFYKLLMSFWSFPSVDLSSFRRGSQRGPCESTPTPHPPQPNTSHQYNQRTSSQSPSA